MEIEIKALLIGLSIALPFYLAYQQANIAALKREVADNGNKLNLILTSLDVSYDPIESISDDIKSEIFLGNRINAIKLIRTKLGLGLKDAADLAETFEASMQQEV
ncbi:MAG: ribosomal protein L7/L12 [Flavobacteriales bacterium]|jgi:ribosomal protein L7/L12